MKLVELKPDGRFVFIGDTHGDLQASKKVINTYLDRNTKICFLGDYVDRGYHSKENADYLIEKRRENPDNVHLLQGNHETYHVFTFSPANFWDGLGALEKVEYSKIFKEFSCVFSVGDIIALHGALPDINKIEDINNIKERDKNWLAVLWGDFEERYPGESDDYYDGGSGRPTYGRKYFDSIIDRLKKNVLIRSHQPDADPVMFDKRCLTIFTSNSYMRERTVAIADFDKNKRIKNVDDLVIEVV